MENLKQFEWFVMRRGLGPKPRRFSPAFITSERAIVAQQRDYVRLLQQGIQPKDVDGIQIGTSIPLPLSVGRRVLAHVNHVQGGPEGWIFPGFILGICSTENAYRVEFDFASLGVQTVLDTDLAPFIEPLTIPVNVLMKERVHVPSAGITERPRIHKKTTSIQNLEQNRKAFSGGQNVMSTELMTHTNEDNAARSRTQMNMFFDIAGKIAADAMVGGDADDSRWVPGDLRLLAVTEQLLQIKRALLVDQESLNSTAQRSLVEETTLNSDLRQCYRFIVRYIDSVNAVLQQCLAAIKHRKRPARGGPPEASLHAGMHSPSVGELEHEQPIEKAQELTETAFVRSFGNEAKEAGDQRHAQLKQMVQHYTSLLLVVRACAQGLESPEETAMLIREMQRERNPASSPNKKFEEDVQLQLATLKSTVGMELTSEEL
jgi:hypothetical protein